MPDRPAGSTARRSAFARHPVRVAPVLLGALLTSRIGGGLLTVRISEVEAYGGVGEDPGSHAHRRRTDRNAAMFGPVGHAYVYFTYGMHWCLNVVAHQPGAAGAVLLRAGEVVAGMEVARPRRPAARSDRELARGPARLAAALGVDGSLDGTDLLERGGPLELRMPDPADQVIARRSGPRTGIAGEGSDTPWRFWLPDDATVSLHRRGGRRR